MTDEEKKALQGLSQDELIDMLDTLRTEATKNREQDKKAVIDRFLNGSKTAEADEDVEEADVFDLEENKAFQRLKKKFNNK